MSTTTTNFGLIKPELSDTVNISDFNSNFDTLDTELAKVAGASSCYIIEANSVADTDGNTWYYREWSNGTIEAFSTIRYTQSGASCFTTRTGYLYRQASTFVTHFPSSLFTSAPALTGTMHPMSPDGITSKMIFPMIHSVSSSQFGVYFVCTEQYKPYSGRTPLNVIIDVDYHAMWRSTT